MAAAVAGAPGGQPASCQAVRQAMVDEMATLNGRTGFPMPAFGPMGAQYASVADRLSFLMKSDNPDMAAIEKLWREADRLKLALHARSVNAETQCRLDTLRLMPATERKNFLRQIAPMSQDERRRIPMAPPAPR